MYIKLLLIISIVAFTVNIIFIFNKTVYTLITSVFIFLFSSIFLLYLELEFLALSFAIIYIGGIAVMFLFLILIVDVKVENTKSIFFSNNSYISISLLTILSSFISSIIFLVFYNPFNFNLIFFLDLLTYLDIQDFNEVDEILKLNFYLVEDDFLYLDLAILGVFFLRFHPLLLILIALYLFIATVVSILLCVNIFEPNIN
jgi:NADH:ubiquinone oxidoreductase subunit 6 (subunit J)